MAHTPNGTLLEVLEEGECRGGQQNPDGTPQGDGDHRSEGNG